MAGPNLLGSLRFGMLAEDSYYRWAHHQVTLVRAEEFEVDSRAPALGEGLREEYRRGYAPPPDSVASRVGFLSTEHSLVTAWGVCSVKLPQLLYE